MDQIIIVGTGGFARELFWHLEENLLHDKVHYQIAGFIGKEFANGSGQTLCGVPILGDDNWAFENLTNDQYQYLIGIGSPRIREVIAGDYSSQGFKAFALIPERANISGPVELGPGSVICPGASLTTDILIGAHVHINLNVTLGHDCVIGDYVTIYPGANISGNVWIRKGAEIGSGAVILPGIEIGKGAKVGAGAVVLENVPAGETWVGVPARPSW